MRRLAVALGAAIALVALTPSPAAAHPLGNFTVNHYHGLRLLPDRIDDHAVLDDAEIPTLQQRSDVDVNADDTVTDAERTDYAAKRCRALADDIVADVDGRTVAWTVVRSDFGYRPGAAGLDIGRTECRLQALADVRGAATVTFADRHHSDRIGWREITATGDGVGLRDAAVPTTSVSDELRTYPEDLLTSPLDQRSVTLTIGAGGEGTAATTATTSNALNRSVGALGNRLDDIAGSDRLTPLAGLLAVVLALLLGGAHAALPGHGKTVMAAYIAGRRGTYRDAVIVGATVTATHTGGVLLIGLLLTTASTVAGEALLGWLGAVSGLIITIIGASLLARAVGTRRYRRTVRPASELVAVGAAGHDHHHHGHDHPHEDHHQDHGQGGHSHGGHSHGGHGHSHGPIGRGGLVGLGVAGGLVPSPSALIVLLGTIALGRTWFGVLLVVAYGLGMAAVLTAAGLLLIHLHGRVARRVGALSGRISAVTPVLAAVLILTVGVVLTVRAVGPLL